MRLKGLEVRQESDATYTITPIFYGVRGGSLRATALRKRGSDLRPLVAAVLNSVPIRRFLTGLE